MLAPVAAVLLAASPANGRVVYLVPLGKVEAGLLEVAQRAIADRVEATVKIARPRELPPEAWYPPRRRWRAEKLLGFLDREAPEDTWKVVGVTEVEISTTKGAIHDWGIAGLGDIAGKACVLSSFLYQKHSRTRSAMERRFADVVVHEFGHTLGLDHCGTKACVMADAKGKAIRSADQSTTEYCPFCRSKAERGALKPR